MKSVEDKQQTEEDVVIFPASEVDLLLTELWTVEMNLYSQFMDTQALEEEFERLETMRTEKRGVRSSAPAQLLMRNLPKLNATQPPSYLQMADRKISAVDFRLLKLALSDAKSSFGEQLAENAMLEEEVERLTAELAP